MASEQAEIYESLRSVVGRGTGWKEGELEAAPLFAPCSWRELRLAVHCGVASLVEALDATGSQRAGMASGRFAGAGGEQRQPCRGHLPAN